MRFKRQFAVLKLRKQEVEQVIKHNWKIFQCLLNMKKTPVVKKQKKKTDYNKMIKQHFEKLEEQKKKLENLNEKIEEENPETNMKMKVLKQMMMTMMI